MADRSWFRDDKASSSPSSSTGTKAKVMRSQRIAQATSPVDERDDEDDEAHDRSPPPMVRSHTPGHLASKSTDRRRKPSELSIRQRSQSAAGLSSSQTLSSVAPLSSKAHHGPLSASSTATTPNSRHANGGESSGDIHRHDSSAGEGGRDGNGSGSGSHTGRRPHALRSTSAIASKPGAGGLERSVSSAVLRNLSISQGAATSARNNAYTAFPPLTDPKTAPDVLPAPSSGMYWSKAPVSGHAHTALRAHTTTLVGSSVYVFGGCDSRACFNDLYVLDADAFYWTAPQVAGDVPLPLRAMTCTAVGKKLVVFGGGDGPAYYNDVYVLDTVNFRWSRPRIVGDRVPSKRRAHTACLYKNGIYVFGGGDGVRALNDIWRLDVSDTAKMSWKMVSGPSPEGKVSTPLSAKDLRPKARGYHTANMVGSKLIIFGGSDGGECFNDVWVYDVDTHLWKQVSIPTTFRRLSHTATIVGSYLFVVGGHDGNEYSNDVLLLNLVTMTWDRRKVYGLPPSGRGYHGTVIYDSRLLVIGGFDGSEVFGDVWILELAVHSYYSQISHFTIEV